MRDEQNMTQYQPVKVASKVNVAPEPKPLIASKSFWGQLVTSLGLALQLAKPVIPLEYHPLVDAVASICVGGTALGVAGTYSRTRPVKGILRSNA